MAMKRAGSYPNGSHVSESLAGRLAKTLPKDFVFKLYYISTPPTKASAIYSAPPGTRPDKTYCESHFLTVTIDTHDTKNSKLENHSDVLVFAIEILIYSTAYSTTHFVSKADSTGYLHLLRVPKHAPSTLRDISSTFLAYLVEERQRPGIPSIVSLFARAQDQYLFPGSIENCGKHALDDRGLIRWWSKVFNSLLESATAGVTASGPDATQSQASTKGYLLVPGLDRYETISYLPRSNNADSRKANWTIGHPLENICRHPHAPPRCFIPHFPDDPKARFLDELDEETSSSQGDNGRWKSVTSIDQFWEMMAYRQECSAGRLVGFMWIVFKPAAPLEINDDTKDTAASSSSNDVTGKSTLSSPTLTHHSATLALQDTSVLLPIENRSSMSVRGATPLSSRPQKGTIRKLRGPIVSRKPRVKTHSAKPAITQASETAYYTWPLRSRGQIVVEESDYKRITELLLRLDFADLPLARGSTNRWVEEVRSGSYGQSRDAWGEVIIGSTEIPIQDVRTDTNGAVNTLNAGLVRNRKKRGMDDETKPTVPASKPSIDVPTVNVLGIGTVRKKAKVQSIGKEK